MNEIDRIIAKRRGNVSPSAGRQIVPGYADPEQGFFGGFVESAVSSLPELVGTNPSAGAVAFRAKHPVSGFVSEVLPAMIPYGGMYALSRTAKGAAALSKGMQGVKAVGARAGLNVVDRPVIAGAVKEMLRYSPLELGRLGVGAVINPENTGELFADVALSTAFAGGFGGVGGYLRAGGFQKIKDGVGRVLGQDNMFAHPTIDLRAIRQPEAKALDPNMDEETLANILTKEILNDKPIKGHISGVAIPLINGVQGATDAISKGVNALFKFNSREVKERGLSRQKFWEGDAKDNGTLNEGELLPAIKSLGFDNVPDFAENVLSARVLSVQSDRVTGTLAKMLDSPAIKKIGDDALMAQTDTGATLLFKRISRAEPKKAPEPEVGPVNLEPAPIASPADDAVALDVVGTAKKELDDFLATMPEKPTPLWNQQYKYLENKWLELMNSAPKTPPAPRRPKLSVKPKPKPPEPAPLPYSGMFKEGDRWAAILTDRPGAFIKDLEKLNASNQQTFATMRRMFQPMGGNAAHVYNAADDQLLQHVSPLDVYRLQKQSRKTWVAETAAALKNRAVGAAGLTDSYALQKYADNLYDMFAPGMFKEQRNSLYARYTGLLQNRLRVVNEKVGEVIFGREMVKAGARGVMGKNFERIMPDGGPSFRQAVQDLTDEEFDLVAKALMTQTPAKDIKKLAKDGVISPQALAAVQRMQDLNAQFMNDFVLPATRSMGEKSNFNLLEGYVIPRILPGDWRTKVLDAKGNLIYLAAGKTRGQAEKLARAIVEEGKIRGQVYTAPKTEMKHVVEMKLDDMTDIFEDVGKKLDADPVAAEVVQSAVKRMQFVGVKREAKLPFRARAPGNLVNERTGIAGNSEVYTREEFIKAFEANLRKMGNFAAVHSYMERWGNEIMSLRGNNETLYNDVMRRAQQAMGVEGQITRTLNNVLSPVLGPQLGSKAATKIAAATNATLYAWQLGILNPTFALLNALSPLQTVLPQLAFVMTAPSARANKLLHYMPLMDGGRTVNGGGFLDPMRVMAESIRQLRHADPDLQQVHARLRNDGTLHPQLFEEHIGAGASRPDSLKQAWKQGGWANFIYEASTWMSTKSEDFARVVSANSGFLVGRDMLKLEGDQLYHFTRRFVESTNYMYNQSDRARIITGPVGSVFGLFKNWQMHFIGMMANYADLAINEKTFAPLLWQAATATTLGGLGATPLKMLADGIANYHEVEEGDSFLWLQNNFGKPWADAAWFGPAGILGISLQASSTIPGTDVRNDLQSFTSAVALERAKQLGKAMGEGWSTVASGENPLADSNFRNQLWGAVAPRAMSRAASVIEGDYVNSMATGQPQMQNPSFTTKLVHGLGMNTTEIERYQTVGKKLYKEQTARKAATTDHGKALSEALQDQDYEAIDRIQVSAMAQGLSIDSIWRSAKNLNRREEGDLLDRYKGEDVARARAILGQ